MTLSDAQEAARAHRGRCLSQQSHGTMTKLAWECEKGHVWEALPSNIIYHREWCPECAGNKRGSLEQMKVLAETHGGQCLSNEYIDSRTPLLWACSNGHQWKAQPVSVSYGHWCSECVAARLRSPYRKAA